MPQDRIDIFISSVMESMVKERETVAEAIKTRNGLSSVFAETWPAHDDPPMEVCKRRVQNCHIYIGLFDREWGYIPSKDNPQQLSMTAFEYHWAKEKSLPKFIFVSAIEENGREPKLAEFFKTISDVYKGHWFKKYSSTVDLREQILAAIDNLLIEKFHGDDDVFKKAIAPDALKAADTDKRRRDKIVRDIYAEVRENELKASLINKTHYHQFDTRVWNEYKGDLVFLGSGDYSLLELAYVNMKEKNTYLDGIKSARDKRTEIKWLNRYALDGSLDPLKAMLGTTKGIFEEYLGASGTYPAI